MLDLDTFYLTQLYKKSVARIGVYFMSSYITICKLVLYSLEIVSMITLNVK